MKRGVRCKGCGAKATRSTRTRGHLAPEHDAECPFVDPRPRRQGFFKLEAST